MADNNDPVFQIQRVYMKEASLEQPNSPAILLEQQQPSVDIQLGVEAQQAAEGMFEVAVAATVTTKLGDKTVMVGQMFVQSRTPARVRRARVSSGTAKAASVNTTSSRVQPRRSSDHSSISGLGLR